MDTVIPPKVDTETHEDYMKNFVDLLVETTKHSSTYDKLLEEAHELMSKIVDDSRPPMMAAAKNKHATARIYVYLIGMHGFVEREYDLLFPTDHLKREMEKLQIPSVFDQVKAYLAPLLVEHKIYEVYKSNTVEIHNYTGDLPLLDDLLTSDPSDPSDDSDDLSGGTPVEGVKKLQPVKRYVGVITVSWGGRMDAPAVESSESSLDDTASE